MSDIAALIAKLEAATGPTQELMRAAFDVCFPEPSTQEYTEDGDLGPQWIPWSKSMSQFGLLISCRGWTDAALMLVPEGYYCQIGNDREDKNKLPFYTNIFRPGQNNPIAGAEHPHHIALAIAIAALRARAA